MGNIRRLLSEAAKQRHDLQHCIHSLQMADEDDKRGKLQEYLEDHRNSSFVMGLRGMLTADVVNTFSEEDLGAEERLMRDLARTLGIPIPDAEAIFAQYQAHAVDSSGVGRDGFLKMLHTLKGHDQRSPAQANDLFRSIDNDGDGRISFPEYLVWYSATC